MTTAGAAVELDDQFHRAVAIEPELARLETFVTKSFGGDLPTVENWILRMNRIIERRTELHQFHKGIFARLIRTHNAALAGKEGRK